jgi:hypothetical protein
MRTPRTYAHPSDPRRLRELFTRTLDLAALHAVPSVVVGLAGPEGELLVPELIEYVESELRVEDAVFRLTRERAVLFLADVRVATAREIVERLLESFRERFPSARSLAMEVGYHEVEPGSREASVKAVLPRVFPASDASQPN